VSDTHHLSQATFDRLKAEHEELTTHGRTDIARKIQAARELGDLSENGDYHAAKDEQGHMEGRIRHLEWILENCEIVEDAREGVVSIGSLVTILYEGDDEDDAEVYLIGHIEEAGAHAVISPTSPLGTALMGHAVGDQVEFEAPSGTLAVLILAAEVA
jgi:transcription elongation factor GreA